MPCYFSVTFSGIKHMETEKSYIRFQLVFLKRTFINLQRHFKKIIIVIIFQCKKSYFNALKKNRPLSSTAAIYQERSKKRRFIATNRSSFLKKSKTRNQTPMTLRFLPVKKGKISKSYPFSTVMSVIPPFWLEYPLLLFSSVQGCTAYPN